MIEKNEIKTNDNYSHNDYGNTLEEDILENNSIEDAKPISHLKIKKVIFFLQ